MALIMKETNGYFYGRLNRATMQKIADEVGLDITQVQSFKM